MNTTKQFGISSDNYYAKIIFDDITRAYLDALRNNDVKLLFLVITQYYQTTQHFYQKQSEAILTKINEAGELISPTKSQNAKQEMGFKFKNTEASIILHECWRLISNYLQKDGFFKRVYTNDETELAIQVGRSR